MTAVVPDLVMIKPLAHTALSGTTERRLVEIYMEASGAVNDTIAAATYVPGLSALSTVDGVSAGYVSTPTISGTTITLKTDTAAKFKFTGYYS